MTQTPPARTLAMALGPILWGTTYVVFTHGLPAGHPLLVSALRALLGGALLLVLVRRRPARGSLPRLSVLALTNIGLFFALLLISAQRLPGGITATLAACQPLLVALISWPLLGRRPTMGQIVLAAVGMAGVGLLVQGGPVALDPLGVPAGLGAALSMACGIVLTHKWRDMSGSLAATAWQLTLAGLFLLPVALLAEGLPGHWTAQNSLWLGYLAIFVTALAYWLWLRGLGRVGPSAAVLAFLSPMTAFAIDAAVLDRGVTAPAALGLGLIVLSLGVSAWQAARRRAIAVAP